MTVFDGIIQGVVQGLTEFLPVSSDGHLTLVQHFTGQSGEGSLFFTILLHLGTLFAVFFVYRKTIWELIREFFAMLGQIFRKEFHYKTASAPQRMIIMILLTLVPLLGFFFVRKPFGALAEDDDIIVEGLCFLYTGVMLLLADRCTKGHKTAGDMKPSDSLWIGFFQGIAALPGASRSGSTISVGLLRGLDKEFAVSFSFIMGIPAIIGANVFAIGDAVAAETQIEWVPVIVGVLVSAVVGIFAIKLIAWLIRTDHFAVFAYYTLILGTLTLAAGIWEHIAGQNLMQILGILA